MDIISAQKKAEKLSLENESLSIVYVKIDHVSLGKRHVEYDAMLLENYTDDEECIDMYFSKGKPTHPDFV
jgi:hypothetical protein